MNVKQIATMTADKYHTHSPFDIADRRGVRIIYSPLKSVLGYYTRYKRIQCIILQEGLPYPLRRFVCAHELGHSICHADLNTQWLKVNTLVSTDRIEREASTFAVELLLPDDLIRNHSECDLYTLSKIVGIPKSLTGLKNFNDF
ncbi:MAG: ImmA/IrrE family metallo-endopeptidase [Megasphaera cerevisiae]|jgi:Zn-dependent peptidase ImmA (M78 family)|nr:ImmA/IrrE family metallo-endopeptidase [Megasphaera cerevisiae]